MGRPHRSSGHEAVVLYPARAHAPEHEASIHHDIALRIADLLDVPFEGVHDAERHQGLRCYFIPTDTLITRPLRESLGIRDEFDLFGGCADFPFLPTKAISHGVVGPQASRPDGWSDAFSERVSAATLPGYTAFSRDDVRAAAQRLMDEWGTVRLKPVHATAGRGQRVLRDLLGLDGALTGIPGDALSECGVVLEANLEDVRTYSVGQVRFPGLTTSYVGTQRITHDNQGCEVYGGSRLRFARGGYEDLLALPLDESQRQAVQLARRYDEAADACYPALFASRRNYDIGAGTDARGRQIMGVLEQSWRIGGASRAEIAALEVLSGDPACTELWAETLELFGDAEPAPAHAVETYSGHDPDLGLIRKYVMVEAYGNNQ